MYVYSIYTYAYIYIYIQMENPTEAIKREKVLVWGGAQPIVQRTLLHQERPIETAALEDS